MKFIKRLNFISFAILSITFMLLTPAFANKTKSQAEEFYKTGVDYFFGKNGKSKDYKKAKEYLQKACYDTQNPVAAACNDIGVIYYEGYGEEVDYTKAKDMFELACFAPKPSYESCGLLSGMYFLAHGVSKNWHKAKNLAIRSCEQDIAFGCFFLAVSYLDIADLANTKTYMQKACDLKHKEACELLKELP